MLVRQGSVMSYNIIPRYWRVCPLILIVSLIPWALIILELLEPQLMIRRNATASMSF